MPLIYINLQFFENIRQLEQQPQEIIPSGSGSFITNTKRSILKCTCTG